MGLEDGFRVSQIGVDLFDHGTQFLECLCGGVDAVRNFRVNEFHMTQCRAIGDL